MKTIVSIKELFYADPISTVADKAVGLTGAEVAGILKTAQPINNVHGGSWVYEEAEPSVTDYINQLNGKIYYRDTTPGAIQVSFSIGQYDYQTKADLQGGVATATSWKRNDSTGLKYKCLIAKTSDGTYIVLPNACVTARGGMVEDKVLGLMLAGVAMDSGVEGLESEAWFDASEVVAA